MGAIASMACQASTGVCMLPLIVHRRMMAEGVGKLQGSLAAGALAALGSGQQASPLEGSLLPLPSAAGGALAGRVGVSLTGSLRLPDIRLP